MRRLTRYQLTIAVVGATWAVAAASPTALAQCGGGGYYAGGGYIGAGYGGADYGGGHYGGGYGGGFYSQSGPRVVYSSAGYYAPRVFYRPVPYYRPAYRSYVWGSGIGHYRSVSAGHYRSYGNSGYGVGYGQRGYGSHGYGGYGSGGSHSGGHRH